MSKKPPSRTLPEHPDLDQLKRQAKELLDSFRSGETEAVAEVKANYRGASLSDFALHDAQLALARSYGFESWPKLKAYVDGVTAGRLCEAVQRGDVEAVRHMLRQRPEIVNLEWPGHGEERAVHISVLRRDQAMVRLLMQNHADARLGIYPNRDASSALTIASERGYEEIVDIIREEEQRRVARLAGSADVPDHDLEDVMDSSDQNELIARLAADPNLIHLCHPDGWTPLHYAAGALQESVVEWLLDHGADPNRRAKGQWTPLDFAASARLWRQAGTPHLFRAVAGVLLRSGAVLGPISAVAMGRADWVRAQHAAGTLGNATSLQLFEPLAGLLSTAVKHDQHEMLVLLLDLGIDPDERLRVDGIEEVVHSWGNPLYLCARSGKLAMAKTLLDRGADPNAQVYASGSPTFAAHCQKDTAMIELLESRGGAIDAASVGYVRQTERARKMLAGEIDPQLEYGMFSGQTLAEQLLWSGASGGDPEIVRMALEQVDWTRDNPRWFSMLWRPLPGHWRRPESDHGLYLACFRQMLDRCDPNVRAERFGQTMLHEVVARDHGEGVGFARLLLDAGARMDVRDDLLKSTPLGWACRWGRVELVKLLLERGADPLEAEAEPWATPKAWAEKMGHDTVLAVLRQHEPRG